MTRHNRIVVIGGTACGPKTAARARRCDPTAEITIVEESPNVSSATCGLPYYVSGIIKNRSSLVVRRADYFKDVLNVEVLTETRALNIDCKARRIEIARSGLTSTVEYDKLVLATGAAPIMPHLEGRDLNGIYSLRGVEDAERVFNYLASRSAGKAVVVGAGLIGMEMAESLASRGLKVTIVEALDRVLCSVLDEELASVLAGYMRQKGIELRLGEKVVRFEGVEGIVQRVITEKAAFEANIVVMATGVRPNVRLARDAGLKLGTTGAIAVNEYLQTSDPDIYAGGDCVENTHLVSGTKVYAPMGSTANKHGRVIGTNITGGKERFPGVLGTGVVRFFDCNVGGTGLGEKAARDAGFDAIIALVPGPDHANYYPGGKDILLKVIADRRTGRLLGGQGVGAGDLAKRIDVLVTAITCGGTLDTLANLDLGYAPQYNSAMDPLHNTANLTRNKLSGMAHGLTPAEVKAKLDRGEDFVLLDVREQEEWDSWRIEAPQIRLVPQAHLRQKLSELPRDREIVVLCRRGARAYQAQRTLQGAGFNNVKFMEGSLTAWPYEHIGGEVERFGPE